jgi:CheY-like chemotaxis protein
MTAPKAPKSILVIDDEPDLSSTIRRILEWAGHIVTCAETGKDALQQLQKQKFDVVITDIFMPDIDGPQVIAATRMHQRTTRVVAISGGGTYMTSPDALNVARKLGADVSLMKPFTPSQLLAALEATAQPPAAS